MAQIKFSELTEITTRDATTELVVLHGAPLDNARITADNLLTGISGGSVFSFVGNSVVAYTTSKPFQKNVLNSYIQVECSPAMYGLQGDIEFLLSQEITNLGVSTNQNLFIIDATSFPGGFNDYYCQGNYINDPGQDYCDNVPPAVFEFTQYNQVYTSSSNRYDPLSIRKVIKDDGSGSIKVSLDSPIDANNRFMAIQVYTDALTNQASYINPPDLAVGFSDPFDRFYVRAFFENGTNRIYLSAYPKTSEQA